MLDSSYTRNGTGILISGDYTDLINLYNVIHKISNNIPGNNKDFYGQHMLLMNFAYEIRKAYSGDRESEIVKYIDETTSTYYSTKFVWTDILIFITVLRHYAAYSLLDRLDQSTLYLLEHNILKSMREYDIKGYNILENFFCQRIDVFNKYALIIYQAIHIEFVSQKPGKLRFQNMYKLFIDFCSTGSNKYKALVSDFEEYATN